LIHLYEILAVQKSSKTHYIIKSHYVRFVFNYKLTGIYHILYYYNYYSIDNKYVYFVKAQRRQHSNYYNGLQSYDYNYYKLNYFHRLLFVLYVDKVNC
jgi:hypothetical protein